MKFLLIAAAVVAVAVAGPARFVNPGIAGPAPIVDIDPSEVISVGPAIVGESPVVVDDWEDSPISVGPALVEEESPISVGPAIIPPGVGFDTAPVPVYSSPLVQVIVNVNSGSPAQQPEIDPTPVIVVEQPEVPEPVIVAPIEFPEIKPTPVIVVEQPEVPEAVIVAPIEFPEIEPTPVIVVEQPIEVAPVVTLPDELN